MTHPSPVRVLIVGGGGGGREHALAWAIARSPRCAAIFAAPGNAGTALLGINLAVAADDAAGVARAAREHSIDLVVIGPDAAIAAGVADACRDAGIAVFGPTAAAGRIETSKRYAKQLMDETGIPTARWRSGGPADREQLLDFAGELDGRCVVKADGLAQGKGVAVCATVAEAEAALNACLRESRFGGAGAVALVEERLAGREVSVFAASDGERVRMLGAACDYKRAFDNDEGPNTGGMGAYTPPLDLDLDSLFDEVARTVVQPCIDALRAGGNPFVGCLYPGLMLTEHGIRVLEFNARFGDPETQVLLPSLDEDVLELFIAAAEGNLRPGRAGVLPGAHVAVILTGAGYPGTTEGGAVITGLGNLDDHVLCFHGGTRLNPSGHVETAGGRVLAVVASGGDTAEARRRAYANVERVHFAGARYRADIATRS